MSTIDAIGFRPNSANAVQRLIQRIASSPPGAWFFQRTLYPIDKWLYRATNGRVTVPGILAGLPVVMLTTTGAKSGKLRTMPLVGVPVGADLAVIGSNFGQEQTPGWVYNLETNPGASISYGGQDVQVVARRADDQEADEAFRLAEPIYAGYAHYRERAAHRQIRVFILHAEDA
jgi:deazaflavin-dependent oxidoreductase (nitroreductase family)